MNNMINSKYPNDKLIIGETINVNDRCQYTQLKNKVIGIKDLSYTGEFGLNELVDKSHDLLEKQVIISNEYLEDYAIGHFMDQTRRANDGTAGRSRLCGVGVFYRAHSLFA